MKCGSRKSRRPSPRLRRSTKRRSTRKASSRPRKLRRASPITEAGERSSARAPGNRGAAFVTGTSTGIGAAIALHLANEGFHVLAGVRLSADGEALSARTSGVLTPVIIDVTQDEQIKAAADEVTRAVGVRGLAGLVNNAGIVRPGPLEFQPIADFRHHLDVNLVGPVAVTQALMPMIRRGNGRIVNVGSIGGRLALPMHGAYSASKFGMEAVTDALRLELRQWRIHVSLVDPGATQSAIFDKTLRSIDETLEALGDRECDLYDEQLLAIRGLVEKTAAGAADPIVIAKVVYHALTSDKPKTRYLAGTGAKEAAALARTATDGIKDLAIAKEVGLPDPK